ncbi:MAG TPA: pilus assembly protein TadG-related protein [Bryobacteraceae bacterium]|jgi:Flp pilus assembly protein TadG|nr:pilus assembly protein TadG-related protein [Bryobacteraceae bacterium]
MTINNPRKGYVLVATAFGMVVVLGAAGLAVDVGRAYVARSEVQAYADAAAIAAAAQLNGTSTGISSARSAAQNVPNKWNFGGQSISSPTIQFAQPLALNQGQADPATWTTAPATGTNYLFVQVTGGVNVPITLMQAITSQATMHVTATAQGGQVMVTTYMDGLLPFSPIVPDATDTVNYGYQTGQLYTLRYPSNGGQNAGNICPGDVSGTYWQSLPSQDHGFWGSNSSSALRGEIVDDTQAVPITIGESVPMVGGNRTTEGSALNTRVMEDTDPYSATYAAYEQAGTGNGRRVIGVPVNSGNPNFTAVAVRAFFLQPAGVYSAVTGSTSICAEYIGTYKQTGTGTAAAGTGTGGYLVRLTQ